MTLQELEARLKTLEDVEEIQKLQRAYGYYAEHWEGQQIIDLFSHDPNASVEVSMEGLYIGYERIKQFFDRGKVPPTFLHPIMLLSGIVDVDPSGKTAKGRWYGFGPQAKSIIGTREGIEEGIVRAIWMFGVYENEYIKEDGKWKFKKIHYSAIFDTPYEDGWVKTPEAPLKYVHRDGPLPLPSTCFKPYPSGYILPYHYKNPVSGK